MSFWLSRSQTVSHCFELCLVSNHPTSLGLNTAGNGACVRRHRQQARSPHGQRGDRDRLMMLLNALSAHG